MPLLRKCFGGRAHLGDFQLTELGMTHSSELLKGTLQTIILKILKDHGKTYGYEITQRVKDLSGGSILLTEGALYPTLHRLESEGLLKTESVTVGKRVRKYYMLTTEGKQEVKERVSEFVEFMKTMTQVLQVELR